MHILRLVLAVGVISFISSTFKVQGQPKDNKAKVTVKKRTVFALSIFYQLGALPEPQVTHAFW